MLQETKTGGEKQQTDDDLIHNAIHQVSRMPALLGQDFEHQVGPMPSQVSAFPVTSAGTMSTTKA